MTPYIAWTPDSGTTELSYLRRGWPVEDQHTEELAWWEPKPEVMATARYERAPLFPRLRKVLGGIAVIAGCLVLSAVPSTPMDSPAVQVAP